MDITQSKEIWKPVPGYEGIYEVSDLGRVKSLERTITRSNSRVQTIKERVLRAGMTKNGYYTVALCINKIQKSKNVHSLVLSAFVGKPNSLFCDHINGDRTDNILGNLRYATHSQNGINRGGAGGTSRFKGVCWDKGAGKWRAAIKIDKRTKYLGLFLDEVFAAEIYDKAAKKYYGEFASLNFQ